MKYLYLKFNNGAKFRISAEDIAKIELEKIAKKEQISVGSRLWNEKLHLLTDHADVLFEKMTWEEFSPNLTYVSDTAAYDYKTNFVNTKCEKVWEEKPIK